MPMSKLATKLTTGSAADIFYDAKDYDDKTVEATIEAFQVSVSQAATELQIIAGLDLSGENLSPDDLHLLRDVQNRIK